MSNEKLKSENYSNLGGINSKMSSYLLSPLQFLDIKNFSFQTPGALTQRWGSTQYIGQTFAGQVNSIFEYQKLSGASTIVASHSGGIWFGATTGNYQGMSFSIINATFYPLLQGPTIVPMNIAQNWVFTANTTGIVPSSDFTGSGSFGNFYGAGGSLAYTTALYVYDNPQTLGFNRLSSVVFQDFMFMADGQKFVKFDGVTTYPVGLPPVNLGYQNATVVYATAIPGLGATRLSSAASVTHLGIPLNDTTTGSYAFYASYVNNRGFEGQIWPIAVFDGTNTTSSSLGGTFIHIGQKNSAGTTFYLPNVYVPTQYGISSINVYSYFFNGAYATAGDVWNQNYVFVKNYPANSSTMANIEVGTTVGGGTFMRSNSGNLSNPLTNARYPLGFTLAAGPASNNQRYGYEYDRLSYYPQYLEIYKNRLFCAGFSSNPSTLWFSDVGEPEGFQLGSNFEVRTNDADFVTAMRTYGTRLLVFKKQSIHSLYGDSPQNFYLQEVSVNYGCLNNQCVVIHEDILIFLDRKGVMVYNGAQLQCLSDAVQPIFDTMNYNTAITTAVMIHDKLRNQIMVSIPVNGSATNNITVVYDYLAKAWTTETGYAASSFAAIQGSNTTKNAFYGSYSGTINWFGPSFFADNGTGFTCYFKTRFLHDMGDSVEKQFRRLYLNTDATSTTLNMPLKFYQDYGTSIVYSATFTVGDFQNRIDFGIPAKSLAFELFNLQTSSSLKIYGFTIESRLQRRV